ncbi:zinc finger protein 708-like [Coccinella septempunctata]|uniref:zinc finger protein 708-like n=1 Tax=Coccinella septempunctata TaxID=41139 RepID=UPI001D06AF44|nr:zinc finger protein 708-like [Coccinella septempunctata]
MESEICPQCKEVIEGSSKRIIKDSCGHEKCRVCLLQDVDQCRQCEENGNTHTDDKNIVFHNDNLSAGNNHTTVITCSKVVNDVDIKTENDLLMLPPSKDENQSDESSKKGCGTSQKQLKSLSLKRRYEMITLPSHISTEGTPPTFTCNICKAKFKTKGHVKYHKFCVGESRPYGCKVCNKSFILKSQLSVHELIHTGKKPHICKICEKAFRESGKLKRHMILHTDDKPHICDECGKNFKTLNSLRIHRIIHTGQKPFPCKYCKMRFNNSSNLKKHILSHSDDKTHMCEQCGKKFKQKCALTVHRRSHFHKREFVCEICDKGFINNKDLKRHETIHLDVKIYSCRICSMSFRRKDNLGRHFKNAHPDKKPEIIKREVEPRDKLRNTVIDNPNAINVITSSPMTKKNDDMIEKISSIPRTCMNGPLKLAFKTSAFKKNYNINRDHPYDSNSKEVTTGDQSSVKPTPKLLPAHHNTSSLIFPSVYASSAFSADEYYANRPHVIKNIKFKIPTNYPPENEGVLKTIMHPSHMGKREQESPRKKDESVEKRSPSVTEEKTEAFPLVHQETKDVNVGVTSVIVNSSDQKNMHWRRKMSQNIS